MVLGRVAERRVCQSLCIALAGVIIGAVLIGPAEAARKKTGKRQAQSRVARTYAPPQAALVVDAKTGRTLYAAAADATRHPASITKVMTLYLLFEEMERGRFSLDDRLRITPAAARQPPSKLGIPAGQTITVEDAIKALVTKSANDIAVAIAENISGSEAEFAQRMTRKARELGMRGTVYANASGLPNARQVTTARDLVILGRAIQERFPKQYRYFSTRSFTYRGRVMANHNRLLGRVESVDGIKTGFINASGFNLLTSARNDGRHIVAVVLGGRTASSRDSRMRGLIETYLPKASRGPVTAPVMADARPDRPVLQARQGVRPAVIAAASTPMPIRPPASITAAAAAPPAEPPAMPESRPDPREMLAAPVAPAPEMTPNAIVARVATAMAATTQSSPSALRWIVGPQPATTGSTVSQAYASADTTPAEPARSLLPAAEPALAHAAPAETTGRSAANAPAARSGWIIQVGATDNESKAEDLLVRAKDTLGRSSAHLEPFTEPVTRGNQTLYRARLAGFNERTAQLACRTLKRNDFGCFTVRN